MNVTVTEPVQIALRNMSDDERRRVSVWIDNLKNWDTDPFLERHSRRLDPRDNVYMLMTNTDLRLFFALTADKIIVLEAAKRSTILSSGQFSGTRPA